MFSHDTAHNAVIGFYENFLKNITTLSVPNMFKELRQKSKKFSDNAKAVIEQNYFSDKQIKGDINTSCKLLKELIKYVRSTLDNSTYNRSIHKITLKHYPVDYVDWSKGFYNLTNKNGLSFFKNGLCRFKINKDQKVSKNSEDEEEVVELFPLFVKSGGDGSFYITSDTSEINIGDHWLKPEDYLYNASYSNIKNPYNTKELNYKVLNDFLAERFDKIKEEQCEAFQNFWNTFEFYVNQVWPE